MAGHVVGTMSAPPLPSAPGQFPEAGVGATFASSNQHLQKSLRSLVNGSTARAERNVVDEKVRTVAPQAHALDIAMAALAHTGCGATSLHMHRQV